MLSIEIIQKIPYFSDLPAESPVFTKLMAGTIEATFEEKQLLYLEGEPSQGLYFVVKGQVRVFKSSSRGKEQNLNLVDPGVTFNDVPALDGSVNPASAQALEASTILIIPTPLFRELFEAEAAVARRLAQTYAARLRYMTTLAADISLKHVTARIAKILLTHGFTDEPSGEILQDEFKAELTQQQMAAMAGTVREMVGRSLRSMEASGAIETRRGYILIKDKSILTTLANY
jgi:CRP/FNR family transcriptional regulator